MWHLLHLIARPVAALLGLFCVLTAIVLYPDEEGKIQSKFEDFWVRVDDFQQLALTRHAAFLASVARLETKFLDRIFGHKLISVRAVGASFSFSVLALSISSIFPLDNADHEQMDIYLMGFVLGSLAFGASCVFLREGGARGSGVLVSSVFLLYWLSKYEDNMRFDAGLMGAFVFIIALLGLVCDFGFIVLTRKLLRLAGEMTHSFRVMLVVCGNLLLAICLISPYLSFEFLQSRNSAYAGDVVEPTSGVGHILTRIAEFLSDPFLYCASLTNIFDAALAFLFVLLLALLLVHRALWPLLTRTLFRMQGIGTKGRRAILTAVGLALLSASVFGGKFPELLRELIKSFGG